MATKKCKNLDWTTAKFYRKLEQIEQLVISMDDSKPAILGIVELGSRKAAERLSRRLNYSDFVMTENSDSRGLNLAVLYDKSFVSEGKPIHLEVMESRSHALVLPEGDSTRDVLQVDFTVTGSLKPRAFVFIKITGLPSCNHRKLEWP